MKKNLDSMATKHPHVLKQAAFACVPSATFMDIDSMHLAAPLLSLLSFNVPHMVPRASFDFLDIISSRTVQSLTKHLKHRPGVHLARMLFQREIVSENYTALVLFSWNPSSASRSNCNLLYCFTNRFMGQAGGM